jgi:hypothetical protein
MLLISLSFIYPNPHPATMKTALRFALLVLLVQVWFGATDTQAQNRCSAKATAAEVKQMQFLTGQWQGQLTEQGLPHALQLRFREQNGQIMATVQQEGQLMPLTAQASLCAPNKFHFFGVTPTGESFRFNARLQNEQLVGSLTVGNICGGPNQPAFTLRRSVAVQ